MNQELFNERMAESHRALMDAYASLDPADPKYIEKLKAIQGIHQRIVEDNKNALTADVESQKLAFEREKEEVMNKFETFRLGLEQEKLDLAKAQEAADKRRNVVGWILGGLQIAATVFIAVFAEVNLNKRFNVSAKFEENDAYLTTTDKETVRDGLRPKKSNSLF